MNKKSITWILIFALVAVVLFMNFASAPAPVSKVEIKDKQDEHIFVVPGTQFCVERTLRNKDIDNISPVIAPLFSEGATLESIDVKRVTEEQYMEDVADWGTCQRKVDKEFDYGEAECGSLGCSWVTENLTCFCEVDNDYSCITGYHQEEKVRDIVTYEPVLGGQYKDGEDSNDDEYTVEIFRSGLPDDVRALENIGYSTEFDLEDEATIRMCFRAPPWGSEIKSGRISYMTFYGNGYDYESSTWFENYAYRRSINCDNMTDGILLIINGSSGFHNLSGDCGNQSVISYCSGTGTALYYNATVSNECKYVVANDAGELSRHVFLGNMSDYTRQNAYDQMNTSAAWYFTKVAIDDSTDHGADWIATDGDPSVSGDRAIGNGSILFDGDDRINASSSTNISAISGRHFSMELWLKRGSQMGFIATQESADYACIGAVYQVNATAICFRRGDCSTAAAEKTICTRIPEGWFHFVAVDDGTNFKLYVNGTLNATSAESPTIANSGLGYVFGMGRGHPQAYNGHIGMVRMYDWVLTADQVKQLYQNIDVNGTPGYGDLGDEETADQSPTISAPTILPATVYTDNNVNASATPLDDVNDTFMVEYNWTVNNVTKLQGNVSATNNTAVNISELGYGNYSVGDVINCSVRAFDGTNWGNWNSSEKTVSAVPAADDFDSGVISTGNFTINPLGTVLIVGNSTNTVKLQMYSSNSSVFCCGPDNDGTWSCSSGAC